MLKKVIIFIAIVACVNQLCIGLNVDAKEMKNIEAVNVEEVYEDGSYIESAIISDSNILSRALGVSGKKTYSYKSSSGKLIWRAILTGNFTYSGTSAKCKTASISVDVVNKNWKVKEKRSQVSGASAVGLITMGKYVDGSNVYTMKKTLKLTCTENGKLK